MYVIAYAQHMLSIHLTGLYKIGCAVVSPEYMLRICLAYASTNKLFDTGIL